TNAQRTSSREVTSRVRRSIRPTRLGNLPTLRNSAAARASDSRRMALAELSILDVGHGNCAVLADTGGDSARSAAPPPRAIDGSNVLQSKSSGFGGRRFFGR